MFDISSMDINWALEVAPPSEESPAVLVTSLLAVSLGCQRAGGAEALVDDSPPLFRLTICP